MLGSVCLPIVLSRSFQPLLNQVDFLFRSRDFSLGLLLEDMENINDTGELNRVNRSVSISVMVLDDLEDPGTTKTPEGFGVGMLLPKLSR